LRENKTPQTSRERGDGLSPPPLSLEVYFLDNPLGVTIQSGVNLEKKLR
jgi:hypothetical protein